jgi:hypothetical protein
MKKQKKQAGFIVSAELVMIATVLVIGMLVGMVAIRDALTAEMGDVAEAIGALDQSYSDNGITDQGTLTAVQGSAWSDASDDGTPDEQGDQGAAGDQANIDFTPAPSYDEDVQTGLINQGAPAVNP